MIPEKVEKLLLKVQKPGRYVGGELGAVIKDKQEVDVRFAFCFPDIYEIGMSHLGMKILYGLKNQVPNWWCERVFMPELDFETLMRENDIPLFTLESRTPVREYDLLGITLPTEMNYTNVLEALDLAGIPLHASDRKDDPFVVIGGTCAFNPEPLWPFVDLVALGDGEEEIVQLVRSRLPRHYRVSPTDIQVLTPMQRSVVGASNLNQVLQEAVNPGSIGLNPAQRC